MSSQGLKSLHFVLRAIGAMEGGRLERHKVLAGSFLEDVLRKLGCSLGLSR